MPSICKDCVNYSIEKKNILLNIPESPVNMRSLPFINLLRGSLRKREKKGVGCCVHPDRILVNYETGSIFYQPCSEFNRMGECALFESVIKNPENDPLGNEMPSEDTPSIPDENTEQDSESNLPSEEPTE